MVSSPFPGMDPFLEINPRCEVFHGWFIRRQQVLGKRVGKNRQLGRDRLGTSSYNDLVAMG
jgi:hypothetical protein